jgi:hypothetical protein
VTILDEDIPEGQHQRLRSWRLPVRRIGVEVGRLGMKDREIVTLLHSLDRPTFFSLDHGFFNRRLCHRGYCLVHLDVAKKEAAEFIRRTLRHKDLSARAKRMGAVLRIRHGGISLWRANAKHVVHLSWKSPR